MTNTLKKLLAVLVIVSTCFLPLSGQVGGPGLKRQDRPRCAECDAQFDKDSISVAVANTALNSMYKMALNIQQKKATTADVDRTIMASKMLFLHLEEKGAHVALDSALANRKQAILDYVPSREDAKKIQDNLKTLGVFVSEDRIMNRLSAQRSDKEAMINAMLEGQGIKGMEVRFVRRLEGIRAKVSALEHQRNSFIRVGQRARPLQSDPFGGGCDVFVGGGGDPWGRSPMFDLFSDPLGISQTWGTGPGGHPLPRSGPQGLGDCLSLDPGFGSDPIFGPDPVDPNRCRDYTITAAIFGVCCALGGVPCCIVAAVAELFAALCEAGLPV